MKPLLPAKSLGATLPKTATLVLVLTAGSVGAVRAEPPTSGEWAFRALLDGRPIGEHRFSMVGQGDQRTVRSEARFAVTFLGITAYRYHHEAREQWRGECLSALVASTDDDGKPSRVQAELHGDELAVRSSAGSESLSGCVMSFAYWDPSIRNQTRLLNAQTGKVENVQVRRLGTGSVEVRGAPVAATRWRITGAAQPIDVWYSMQGDWIGLDSTVAGGRQLTYRIE